MVEGKSFWNWPYKLLPHKAMRPNAALDPLVVGVKLPISAISKEVSRPKPTPRSFVESYLRPEPAVIILKNRDMYPCVFASPFDGVPLTESLSPRSVPSRVLDVTTANSDTIHTASVSHKRKN